jgi:hypothetical protein
VCPLGILIKIRTFVGQRGSTLNTVADCDSDDRESKSPPGRAGISSCLLIQTGSDLPVDPEDFFFFVGSVRLQREIYHSVACNVEVKMRATALPLSCASL